MNSVYEALLSRKSVRVFDNKEVQSYIKEAIFNAAFQAPTAGNQMLYSIIDVTVIAAESLGLGSCYIGDILENKEEVVELLGLDEYVVPISMLVMGYPTEQQIDRVKPERFSKGFIVHENRYRRLSGEEQRQMFKERGNRENFDFDDYMKKFCNRKYMSEFSLEMTRSSELYLKNFIR